jgi:hypothetical protein
MASQKYCTVHQYISRSGEPQAQRSEIRLPCGAVIPSVLSIDISARPGDGEIWEALIRVPIVFGEPVDHGDPTPGDVGD